MNSLAQDFANIHQEAFGKAMPANLGSFISDSKIMDYFFGAAAIALLVYLVIGGLGMMLSRGDPKAMQSAQAKITNAVIGFVIVFVAYLLVVLIGQLFGLRGTSFGSIFGL